MNKIRRLIRLLILCALLAPLGVPHSASAGPAAPTVPEAPVLGLPLDVTAAPALPQPEATPAPTLALAPDALSATLYWGEQLTHTLTISNVGSATLDFEIEEVAGSYAAPDPAAPDAAAPDGVPGVQVLRSQADEVLLDVRIPAPQLADVDVGGTVYQRPLLAQSGSTSQLGRPAMPTFGRMLAVPQGASITVEVLDATAETLDGVMAFPAQPPLPDNADADDPLPPFAFDADFYGQDTSYPGALALADEVRTLRGVDVATVRFQPYQYNPAARALTVYTHMRVRVRFTGGGAFADARVRSDAFETLYRRLLLNADQLGAPGRAPESATGAEFLIITDPDFLTAANDLAGWRNLNGVDTEVRTTDDTGSTAAAIQAYIQNAYDTWNPAPSFVLFLGDAEFIPTHYVTTHPYHGTKTGTDLYYATVDGTDYYPDIHTGRISVDTAAEALKAITDIIDYDRNPVTDEAFYDNAAMAAYFQDGNYDGYEDRRFVLTSEEIRDHMLSLGYSADRIYYTSSSINPTHYNNTYYANGEPINPELLRANGFAWDGDAADITGVIDAGRFLITHRDHGATWGWGDPYYSTSHVQALSNGNLLPVVFSMNCQTGWFDNETDEEGGSTPSSAIYFSEAWQRNPNGGAVGVIGATRVSYSGDNDWLTEGIVDAIFPNLLAYSNPAYAEPERRMGPALNYGKLAMEAIWGDQWGVQLTEFEMFHYYGDPTMAIHTELPNPDVAWVREDPISGTVGSGSAVTVDVVFDAGAVNQAGTYTAQFNVHSNDPDQAIVTVPLTLTVIPVGTLVGTVTDARTGAPLSATVEIDGGAIVTQTQTHPATGSYRATLDAQSYQVTALATGYVSRTASVTVRDMVSTTQNFALLPDAPWMEAQPASLAATLKLSSTFTSTLTIHNHGAQPLTYSLCEAATAGACSPVDWLSASSGGSIAPDGSVEVDVLFDAGQLGGVDGIYTAYLRLTGDDPLEPVIEVPVTLEALPWTPSLSIAKTASHSTVEPGDWLTYTLTVANDGELAATGLTIRDPLPAHTGLVSATNGGELVDGAVRWSGLTLPVGDEVTVQFTVQIDAPLANGTTIANAGYEATCAEGVGATGSTVYATVRSAPALSVEASAAPDPVGAGELLTYTITVGNSGNAHATGVFVRSPIPEHTSFVDADAGYVIVSGLVIWTNRTIQVGETLDVQLTVRVDADAAGGTLITNDGYNASSMVGGTVTGDPVTSTVGSMPRLSIASSAAPDPVEAGGLLTYTLTVANLGDAPATGVVITDAVPEHTAFFAADAGGALADGTVSWAVGTIPAGDSAEVHLVVKVDMPMASGEMLVNAHYGVACAEGGTLMGDPVETMVHSAPLLQIASAAAPNPVMPGELLTFTITVANLGNADATGVTVTNAIPEHTTFVAADAGGALAAGSVSWADHTVAAQGTLVVHLTVRVDASVDMGTQITNADFGASCSEGGSATGEDTAGAMVGEARIDVYLPFVVR